MSNVAAGTIWNLPNYVGDLFLIGANTTPFLNMIGGLQGGSIKQVQAFQFPVAQTYALETAAQPSITETASLSAPAAVSYVRSVDVNTCQIFQKQVSMSYAKQSVAQVITADATTGQAFTGAGATVVNELDFQVATTLRQIAVDVEYTFLQGSYQQATAASVAAKCRGMNSACSTTSINAASAALSKDLIDQALRTMAAGGAQFQNCVIFCNAFQKQKLTNIYGYAPEDRNVGGVNIKQIETDFAMLGVVWAPFQSTSVLLIADLAVISPVFCPVPGKGVLFREPLAKAGAHESEQIYGQIGLDHGPEEFHGKIYGLATS